jgi:hypothetical protein
MRWFLTLLVALSKVFAMMLAVSLLARIYQGANHSFSIKAFA